MRITLIGPGILKIPPKGWGAVEILINDHATKLKEANYKVTIVNESDYEQRKEYVKKSKPDIIHCHYDEFINDLYLNQYKEVYFTSHYPYTDQYIEYSKFFKNKFFYFIFKLLIISIPNRILLLLGFNEILLSLFGYFPIFKKIIYLQKNINVICLSQRIINTYKSFGYKGKLYLNTNYAREDLIKFLPNEKRKKAAICVGRIQSRKNQIKLLSIEDLFFVGPIYDNKFSPNNPNYLGEWTREELYKKLTTYSSLLLISKGEAHALVISEALIAGLGLVISYEASANLDINLDFIDVIPKRYISNKDYIKMIIQKNISKSFTKRDEIREYGLKYFSMNSFINKYPPLKK